MTKRILPKADLGTFLQTMQAHYEVFAPGRDSAVPSKFVWKPVESTDQLDFGFVNTDMSPKDFVFPQSECMMRFSEDDPMVLKPEPLTDKKRLLLNVRPCDAKALALLDLIFCQDETTMDAYWQDKRNATLLVGLACNHPCPSCFCHEVNCGPHHTEGLDALLTDIGDAFLVEVLSEHADFLVKGLVEANKEQEARAVQCKESAENAMPDVFEDTPTFEDEDVLQLYTLPFWERVCETCLNCGTCTYACPTCHCFDIQDETKPGRPEQGRRVRNWDTCMQPLFTHHTSGHNPRGSKVSRVRQRFMHKFKYIPMKRNNEIGCVGCGRCVRLCPVNIDIRDVVNAMQAEQE